jgi:hypothetical protein
MKQETKLIASDLWKILYQSSSDIIQIKFIFRNILPKRNFEIFPV